MCKSLNICKFLFFFLYALKTLIILLIIPLCFISYIVLDSLTRFYFGIKENLIYVFLRVN